MREIPLSKGMVALVDDGDYERVARHKWHARVARHKDSEWWYGKRDIRSPDGRKHQQLLHRFIVDAPIGVLVDHKNGNGLDCRRNNLRLADNTRNVRNAGLRSDNTTGFKGVYINRGKKKWRAVIKVDGKQIQAGTFETQLEAAQAYDILAKRHHGEFARTNF